MQPNRSSFVPFPVRCDLTEQLKKLEATQHSCRVACQLLSMSFQERIILP